MERNNSFDALRLFGSLLVIVGHSYELIGQHAPQLAGMALHGIGVKLFFVISGYLIVASCVRDPNLLRFAIRRALRIMPALIVVVVATAVVLAWLTTADADTYWAGAALYITRNALLLPYHVLPGVFESNPVHAVNGSLWTLPVEAFMYALTPLLVLARPRFAVLVLAALLLVIPVTGELFGFGLTGAASVIPYFLLGAFAQLARINVSGWAALACVALLLIADFMELPQIVAAGPFAAIVLYAGRSPWLRGFPVDISYGTYLLAFPVQQILIAAYPTIAPVYLVLATAAIVAPLALASWHFVEAPALRLARRTVTTSSMVKDT